MSYFWELLKIPKDFMEILGAWELIEIKNKKFRGYEIFLIAREYF
jgi:hypothetical protein